MILGLDISTSVVGLTVLDDSGNIKLCDAVDLKKIKNIFSKAEEIKKKLTNIRINYPITEIYIEKPFLFFNSGGSSAATMAILQNFNGVVSWLCYSIFNKEPIYLTAQEARKIMDIKVPRGKKAKEIVLNFILDLEPNFVVEYNKNNNPKPENYDRADSWVIAKSGYTLWQQKNKRS